MRPTLMTNACILCLIVVLKFQPSIGEVDVEEASQPLNTFEQGLEEDVPDRNPLDAMKRAMMRNMLEQHALRLKRGGFNSGFAHALRLKRGGFNSGFAHALRVRRGGIGQRSSWGHALRVRSSNMLNRGHALRIKRKLGANDYRAFALRIKKDHDELNDVLNESLEGQDLSDEAMIPGVGEFEDDYVDRLPEKRGYPDSETDEDVEQYRDKRMRYQPVVKANDGRDLFKEYLGKRYLNNWPFPARRLRSASFAHVLRV